MKIVIVTDTFDNINGVCTTLKNTVHELVSMKHEVLVIEPSQFKTIRCPGYPEIKLSLNIWKVRGKISRFDPDAIHIATEGPLGFAARQYCKRRKIPYNTSYHTKHPETLNKMFNMPIEWGYIIMRWFHKFSTKILVSSESMKKDLINHGFDHLEIWSRGVDTQIFNPTARIGPMTIKRPILLCVSRISKEKGIDDFCKLKTTGTKILIGDGPYLDEVKSKYKDIRYIGYKHGSTLAHFYTNANVFVFPSKTDTFGVVMLEANACGTPVAAYPVTGPNDIIIQGLNGVLNDNLTIAVEEALKCDRNIVSEYAEKFSWRACTLTFLNNLSLITHSR